MAAALGDIFYRAASLVTRLAGNTTTTRKFLRQVGTGAASAAPVWDQVADLDLTVTDITTNNVTTSAHGFAPKGTVGTTSFWRQDWTLATPAGAGDVSGPGASTNTAVPLWNGTSGTVLSDSKLTFTGPASTLKTFTLPNASAAILTDNAVVTVPQGGTGVATLTGMVKGNGTSAMSAGVAGTDFLTSSAFAGQTTLDFDTQSANTAYGDLSHAGPAVTITSVGTVAYIFITCVAVRSGVGNSAFVSVAVSGATTIAASDDNCASASSANSGQLITPVRLFKVTITPGSNTYTLKYHNDGGSTWTFGRRDIFVYAP